MAATIWKGHLTFGLISIPIKLQRAARTEKVSFRQLQRDTHLPVRQVLIAEPADENHDEEEAPPQHSAHVPKPMLIDKRSSPVPAPQKAETPAPEAVKRSDLVKGYEHAPDRYVVISKEELESIAVATNRDMQIVEFVRFAEIDSVYLETSYYVVPEKAGERPYALLLQALRESGFAALAKLAMQRREHVVVIRPGRAGMIAHTMFYETEVRRDNEYRADVAGVVPKELDLAVRLIQSLAAPFDASKYRDEYRDKLDALLAAKIAGQDIVEPAAPARSTAPDLFAALQSSLALSRKPAGVEVEAPKTRKRGGQG